MTGALSNLGLHHNKHSLANILVNSVISATIRQIWLYTLMLIPVTFLLIYPLNVIGAIYGTIAFVLGCLFIKKAWALLQNPDDQRIGAIALYVLNFLHDVVVRWNGSR